MVFYDSLFASFAQSSLSHAAGSRESLARAGPFAGDSERFVIRLLIGIRGPLGRIRATTPPREAISESVA